MKLKDWADKQGISYLTAWRWFKAGDARLVGAYQSDSGTIIVPDGNDTSEQSMLGSTANDVMAVVLKKTVEFSKNNATVEDFAAWILSNYSLKPHTYVEGPRYSRNKPKSEEIQKHFQQFLKPKGEKPKANMFVAPPDALDELISKADDLTAQELVSEIHNIGAAEGVSVNPTDAPEVGDLMKDLSSALGVSTPASLNVTTYGEVTGGVVTRSVDLTPQLNYTGSNNSAFSNVSFNSTIAPSFSTVASLGNIDPASAVIDTSTYLTANASALSFKPTQKEVESASKISALAEKPKRGRKPTKNLGKKQ